MDINKYLNISYKLAASVNFEEFLREIGVGEEDRRAIGNASPIITLTETDGVYTFHSTIKNQNVSFKPGVEFEHVAPDGRNITSLVLIEGDKVIHKMRSDQIPEAIVTSVFSDDKILVTLQANNVTAKREFEKVK